MKILTFLIFLLSFQHLQGQSTASVSVNLTLNSVSLLSIKPNNGAINFQFPVPSTSGGSLTSTLTNNTKWINFTSSVATGTTRKITAQVSSGSIPSGLTLRLQAGTAANSFGSYGTSTGLVTLSGSTTTIINNIGGAYTSVGESNGYNLQFSLSITNYALLRQAQHLFL